MAEKLKPISEEVLREHWERRIHNYLDFSGSPVGDFLYDRFVDLIKIMDRVTQESKGIVSIHPESAAAREIIGRINREISLSVSSTRYMLMREFSASQQDATRITGRMISIASGVFKEIRGVVAGVSWQAFDEFDGPQR